MKKIKFKIILFLIWIIILSWLTYAINTLLTWYRLNKSSIIFVDNYNTCLKNISTVNDYFIPTKTATEWNALNANYPTGVSLCTSPTFDRLKEDWSIRMLWEDRRNSQDTCWTLTDYLLTVFIKKDGIYYWYSADYDTYDLANNVKSVYMEWVTVYKWEIETGVAQPCSTWSTRESWRVVYWF